MDSLKKGTNSKQENKASDKKSTNNKWKNNCSMSSSNELKKNGKLYKWCTGPGHNGVGMWVVHEPGTCTKAYGSKTKDSQSTVSKKDPDCQL